MHNFDLDNALHLVQQEIDDHSLWDQYVATQNDNIHTHGLNNELSFDSFSHNTKEPEPHYSHITPNEIQDDTDDSDFLGNAVDWAIAETPRFVVSIVVGEEMGELFDSDVAKFAVVPHVDIQGRAG